MSVEFETVYGRLQPVLEVLELKRKELKRKGLRRGLWISAAIMTAGLVFSGLYGFDLSVASLVLFLLSLLSVWFSITGLSDELSAYYKKEVIRPLVEAVRPGSIYAPDKGIAESLFVESALFSISPDRYHTEDLIAGRVGKTDFMCAEVHAEEKHVTTNSKGATRTYWTDIFRGFLFIADFHKHFNGRTVVRRNNFLKLCFAGSRVKLENPLFEDKFDVYADDQVEARYLLSPDMMERLLALNAVFGDSVVVSFYESKVLLAIPEYTDHFEVGMFRTGADRTRIKKEFDTICRLVDIVEELNLNTRIWTKE